MEPMARKMLVESPALKTEFEKKLKEDQAFADDSSARLNWFCERTPFYDVNAFVYPVGVVFRHLNAPPPLGAIGVTRSSLDFTHG